MSASRALISVMARAWTGLAGVLLLISAATMAQAEIYTCTGADGITSYQQTPCTSRADEPPDDAENEPVKGREPESAGRPADPPDPELVAACKKRYRDEIDRLDAEIREGFSPDEREGYRQRLRALSQQLGQCDYVSDDTTSPGPGSQPLGGDL